MEIEKTPEVQKILETLKNKDVNATDDKGHTLLMMACKVGNVDLVKALLLAGADVNKAGSFNNTPLLIASYGIKPSLNANVDNASLKEILNKKQEDFVTIVKLLLSFGADVNAKNNEGLSPLSSSLSGVPAVVKQGVAMAAEWVPNSNEYYEKLLDGYREISPDNTAISVALIEAGADVNIQNNNGATPLIYAIEDKNEKMVNILLNAGADPKIRTKEGYDALAILWEKGVIDKYLMLLQKSYDINNTSLSLEEQKAYELAKNVFGKPENEATAYIRSHGKDEEQIFHAERFWQANIAQSETEALKKIINEMSAIYDTVKHYYSQNKKWPESFNNLGIQSHKCGFYNSLNKELEPCSLEGTEKIGSFNIIASPIENGYLIETVYRGFLGMEYNLYIAESDSGKVIKYCGTGTMKPKIINGAPVPYYPNTNPVIRYFCKIVGFAQ